MNINGDRLWNRIMQLGKSSGSPKEGVNRPAFSQADRKDTDMVIEWMKEAGLDIHIDPVGNVSGRREGKEKGPSVLTGSHLDSVLNGGRFDGAAGYPNIK
ncbi:hypothetical protein KK120_19275 [Virgibacillus dakarensis]|nr:hypothetical protein [Virgibacillus dakarensis]